MPFFIALKTIIRANLMDQMYPAPFLRPFLLINIFCGFVCSNTTLNSILYNLCIILVSSLMHAKLNLPSKICTVCQRSFKWRRKWAFCWEEVRYCSRRCRGKKPRGQKAKTGTSNPRPTTPISFCRSACPATRGNPPDDYCPAGQHVTERQVMLVVRFPE